MTARQHVMRTTPSAPAGDASQANISALVERQRAYFASGETRDPNFRHARLKTLRAVVAACERAVLSALRDDLRKPALEAYASEIGAFRVEVNCAIRNVHEWASPATMLPLLAQFPSRAEIRSEPLGVALIIAPWNYPFGLVMAPLVAALAAGNCITVKPSELAPATSHVIAKLLGDNFDPRHIAVTEGGPEVAQALLNEQFDKIFYTGNARVGQLVMQAAARHLTPVTLELGGKSPAIVEHDADVAQAAWSIAAGKFWNAGQTCIAPDYVLVHERRQTQFVQHLKAAISTRLGDDPQKSADYGRIVNARHFARLKR